MNIVLCAGYLVCMDQINAYKPLEHWDVSMGITFRFSLVTLFVTLFAGMLIAFYTEKKSLLWLPVILPILYWMDCRAVLPYRSVAFTGLNIAIYSIYILGVMCYKRYRYMK